MSVEPSLPLPRVSFADAFKVWLQIGLTSFGGPAGQIALMHRLLVEERRWISEERFLHALNYCMLLPGPEAQQLAVYIGWLLHRTAGGLVAGLLFILPGFLLMLGISVLYVRYGQLDWMQGLLFGLQAATLAIVIDAVQRLGRKALKTRALTLLAAVAFVAIFAFGLPFPLVVIGAGLYGLAAQRLRPAPVTADPPAAPAAVCTTPGRTLRVLAVGLALWLLPVALLWAWLGAQHVYTAEAVFFSKMAVVTFGGAYAVLAYMAQQAVQHYGWLSAGEMVQGLALAETTPGPLILVLSYVGFLGAWRDPGSLDPILAGVLGATVSTWVTFVPCFLWIFLGAPYIERLRGNRALSAALAAITAAVVGVILNLSIWFGLHVLFGEVGRWRGPLGLDVPAPALHSLDPQALLLAGLAALALLGLRTRLIPTLLVCGLLGALIQGHH